MTIKTVFFDAAGTLFEPVRKVGESYAAFAAGYGVKLTPAEIAHRFRVCFEQAPHLAFPGALDGQLDAMERAWWRDVVARVFEPCGPFERFETFFDELFAYFANPDAWRLYPEVTDTLTALQQRGVRMSVISNFDSRLLAILDGLGTTRFFDRIIISSRVGYAKPDARIFHAALQQHGISAEEAIHVGDSKLHDLQGATGAGICGILIDRSAAAGESGSQQIATLARILDRIEPGATEASG